MSAALACISCRSEPLVTVFHEPSHFDRRAGAFSANVTGILAQRAKNRPNRLGSTICRIVRREGRTLFVRELDAIEGTPVVDIKPVLREFLPRDEVRQPAWTTELMRDYWAKAK